LVAATEKAVEEAAGDASRIAAIRKAAETELANYKRNAQRLIKLDGSCRLTYACTARESNPFLALVIEASKTMSNE